MAITELQAKNAKAKEKRYMVPDGDGLYLEVTPNGVRSWRYRYYFDGKEKKVTLGRYPDISIKEAREKRNDYRKAAGGGEPPRPSMTFEDLYTDYLAKKVLPVLSPARIKSIEQKITRHILSYIGRSAVDDISELRMLEVLRLVEAQGKLETAHNVRGICGQIFRYGISIGAAGRDPTAALKGALTPRKVQHRARVEGKEGIGALLRAIDGYSGLGVRYALKLQAYTFLRPGELRHIEWAEIAGEELRIPPEKTKLRRVHIVPLSKQALEVLENMRPISGHGKYVFASARTPNGSRPMSDVAMLAALRTLGFGKDEMTVHGFRGIAATELYESGLWSGDAIERQLAHVEGNSVKAAYNYAQHLPERRKLMQWWADYLDGLAG